MIVQKYLGFGNVLKAMDIPYPTVRAPPSSNVVPAEIPKKKQGQTHWFILGGQSNMVGWTPIPEGEPTDPRIYLFGKDYRWRLADHPIEDASNQVNMASENRIAGLGPAMNFAFASLEHHPELVIGLIPCAKNSSGIIQWQRGLSDQSLSDSCLKRVRAASLLGEISGVLFFQGETEAVDPIQYPNPPPDPSDCSEAFTAFIIDFRIDLDEPEPPVVYAQIGSASMSADFSNWEAVKEQQASIRLPLSAMIVTDDLPLLDGLHFTADSHRIIGRRFAEAYWRLVQQP